jgi:integrase
LLADVRRGIWHPSRPEPAPEPAVEPTFHEFATDWLRAREPELAAKTVAGYRWALELHLLPVFARLRLSEITVERVDRYKSAKAREGKLGPAQVNKTLKVLAQILDVAQEYGHLERDRVNPARGRRRRLREPKVARSWVEPEQLSSLLDAADGRMRPLLATLAGAGLRVGEAVASTGARSTSPPGRSASWPLRRTPAPTAVSICPAAWPTSWPSGKCGRRAPGQVTGC